MKVQYSDTYPRPLRVDLIKESYVIEEKSHRANPYNMSQGEYRKMFFCGPATMKTIMKLLEFPKCSIITVLDSNTKETKKWNRHMGSSYYRVGEKYRLSLWLWSSGDIDMIVKNLETGQRDYIQFHTKSTKELVRKAREIKRTYYH